MKTLSFCTVILLVGVLLFCTSCTEDQVIAPSNEDGIEKLTERSVRPFKATYVNIVQVCAPPDADGFIKLCVSGEGNATHLGSSTYYAEQMWNFGTNEGYGLEITFTGANGEYFSGEQYTIDSEIFPEGGRSFFGIMSINNGSDHFEGIEGEIEYYGECTPADGCWIEYDGWLDY